jgi:1,2-phenylacetyl-CoA epoxidase catalytic subunit
MHGNRADGPCPEREDLRAPTLQRKLALTAKAGRGRSLQLTYASSRTRQAARAVSRRPDSEVQVSNVSTHPTKTWATSAIAWLVDAAAIISQKALLSALRAVRADHEKDCWEESFHISTAATS